MRTMDIYICLRMFNSEGTDRGLEALNYGYGPMCGLISARQGWAKNIVNDND